MPDLAESLQGRDLGHLRIIAELWGIELNEQDIREALGHLISLLLDSTRVEKIKGSLSPQGQEALSDLANHAGRLPWAQFTRIYAEVREMGVAKRDREHPHKQPVSAVEELWYHGFLAKAFFDTPAGPEEFAYIPDDLLAQLPKAAEAEPFLMGRQASAAEYANVYLANDHILDHACTLLAALRLGMILPGPFSIDTGEILTPAILSSILSISQLLDGAGMPLPEPVRMFLEAPRGEAFVQLLKSWKQSTRFNELQMLPDLSTEGNWVNDPLRAREVILSYLTSIPAGTWWNLGSFIAGIKQRDPDFQRPGGDYDSWFIHNRSTGAYLRGFEHWEVEDGGLG